MPLSKPKLVILDIDDTLMVSRKWEATMRAYCREKDMALPVQLEEYIEDNAVWRDESGRVLKRATDQGLDSEYEMLKECLPPDSPLLATFAEDMQRIGAAVSEYYVPYDDAQAFVQQLRDEGINIAFVTTAKRAYVEHELVRHGLLDPAQDILLAREDYEYRTKGKKDGFEKAMKHYGVEPGKQVWSVGDATADVVTALEMGCSAVGFGFETLAADEVGIIMDKGAIMAKNPQNSKWEDCPVDRNSVAAAVTFKQLSALLAQSRNEGISRV